MQSWTVMAAIGAILGWGMLAADAGEIRYPAPGNIDLEQGTIEMWLVPRFDPEGEVDSRYVGRTLFELRDSDNSFLLLYRMTNGEGTSRNFQPSGRFEGLRYAAYARARHRIGPDANRWAEGEPLHVAFCWDGDRIWWMIDGEQSSGANQLRPFTAIHLTEDRELVIRARDFVVRDLRISSVPRTPADIGYHHPDGAPLDGVTLLLDRLDQVTESDGERRTEPMLMMPWGDRTGGVVGSDAELTETEIGPGLGL